MTVDEIHGIFTTYEMRTRQNGSSKKEAGFKSLSKNQSENLDDEESLFIKKLEKGIGKYKGKIPLKCFNCGRIGHLSKSVITQKKRIVMMNKLVVIRNINRIRSYTRRSFRKIRKTLTPKKTVKMMK